MQNTSIRIIFVLYTYCILIFFYVMCVCTLFYDTVYKRNIFPNAADKRLILCDLYNEIWTSRRCPTTASVRVRSVKMVGKCAAQVTPEVRGKCVRVTSCCYPTSRWRPAHSARTRHAAGFKKHIWNQRLKRLPSVDWRYRFCSCALVFHPIRRKR